MNAPRILAAAIPLLLACGNSGEVPRRAVQPDAGGATDADGAGGGSTSEGSGGSDGVGGGAGGQSADGGASAGGYLLTAGPANCRDIRNWASRWNPGLDTAQTVPDGFAFSYFGVQTEALTIPAAELPDGLLFGLMQLLGSDWYMKRDFNIDGAVLAPYDGDLHADGLTEISQAMDGKTLVTQWSHVVVHGSSNDMAVDFEVHLVPPGTIEFHYCSGFDLVDKDPSIAAKIWIQNDGGSSLVPASQGHAALYGKAFIFTPQ